MYPPPPRNEKVGFQVKVTFCFWLLYPPPPGMKSWIPGQGDILLLADVPPPPTGMKSWIPGQGDILLLADVPPPPEIEIGLNINAIGTKIILRGHQVHFTNLPPPPFHYHYLTLCLNRKLVNFNFKWIFGLEPHPPPCSSQKNKMLIFGLRSTSGDWLGWSMDSNPICHPSPAKKIKWLFLDYVQLLMMGQAGRWTRTPSATPLQPKK